MNESVLMEKREGVGVIVLNEPATLNALSPSVKDGLLHALDALGKDPEAKVLVLTGRGRAFCAGGDIRAMGGLATPLETKSHMDEAAQIVKKLVHLDKPIIAAVQGYAVGAGFSLALACDLIVAEEGAKFGLAFKDVGLIPDLGLHAFLLKTASPWKIKEWIWNGAMISAEEGQQYGFVNRLVPQGQGLTSAEEWARELAQGPLKAYQLTKSILRRMAAQELEQVLELENYGQSALRQTKDHQEGVQAFREKRPPRFIGE
ncbi:MAG: enoyl-CoA hydratase-related protein [Bacillota bacterium]|nr:hypothetical protein [Bacillota bacterium]